MINWRNCNINRFWRIFFIALYLLANPNESAGSNFKKDSLASVGMSNADIGARVDAFIIISDHFSSFYPDSAILFANKALEISQKNNFIKGEVHAYYALSQVYLNSRNMAKARYYIQEGIRISEDHKYTDGKIEGFMHASDLYELLGKNDSVTHYSLNAFDLSKKSTNLEIQAGVAHDIGNIFALGGAYQKALFYCNQSLDIWNKIGHKNVAGILSDIGNVYYNQHDYKNALVYYKKSYDNAKANNDALAFGFSLNNIGLVYMSLDSIPQAIKYYNDAIAYYKSDLNKAGISNSEGNLGEAYFKSGNYKEALIHARRSLLIALQKDFKKGIMSAQVLIAEVEGKTGHYKEAWEAQRTAALYQDTLNKLVLHKNLSDFETKIKLEKTDNDNKLLLAIQNEQKAELKKENQKTIFLAIILCLCAVIAVLAINTIRKRTIQLSTMAALNKKITEQNQKLEESNNIKTKLFSIISHDFKGPLASLQLFLSLLKSGDLDKLESKEIADDLIDRMNITNTFIDNLLGWAQGQLDGYVPLLVSVNVHDIVEDTFNLYKNLSDLKKIHLADKTVLDQKIDVDENMLKLVLRNLISNALKYTNKDGEIAVSTEITANNITFHVADTGVGMSEKVRAGLFTMNRVQMKGTANESGTGLGLMLCKDFIEKNGGTIWVNSVLGEGSVFSFKIPV